MTRKLELIGDTEVESIRSNFDEYLKSGKRELIEGYSRQELEFVSLRETQLMLNKNIDPTRLVAIKARIDEIKDIETQRRTTREKWFDRIIGFVLGVVSTLLVHLLTK